MSVFARVSAEQGNGLTAAVDWLASECKLANKDRMDAIYIAEVA